MRRAKVEEVADPAKAFAREVRALADRHQTWRVFSDFCELSALGFQQASWTIRSGGALDPELEERHRKIASAYKPEEVEGFGRLLAYTVMALEAHPELDFLGPVFQDLELANHWKGQFFTPAPVCRMMASMTIGDGADVRAKIEERGFLMLGEPAVGSGAMVLAFAAELRALGLEPRGQLMVDATDVDATAARMAYIQFTLLDLPAIVRLGNALTLEEREAWGTFAFWRGAWPLKLRAPRPGPVIEALEELAAVGAEEPHELAAARDLKAVGQISLF